MLALLGGLALAAAPSLQQLEEHLDALLASEVARTEGADAGWSVTHTPLFPGAWPPDGTAVTYAYAWRRDESWGVDRVSGFFGRVRVDAKGGLRFERLAERLEPLGLEARQPVCTKECAHDWAVLDETITLALFKARSVAAFAATPVKVPCPKSGCARRHYENWAEWHGISAWLAAKEEPAFFSWLALPLEDPLAPVTPNTGHWLPHWRVPRDVRWRRPQDGLTARGTGTDGGTWSIWVELSSASISVDDGPDRPLSPAAVKSLRAKLLALRTGPLAPPAAPTETVLLEEPWGEVGHAMWFAFDDTNRSPAAAALLNELKKLR